MQKLSTIFLVSMLSGVVTLGGYKLFFENNLSFLGHKTSVTTQAPIQQVSYAGESLDFTAAAEQSIHTVVHVKNVSYRASPRNPILEYFYGYQGGQIQAQVGTGSGVIISEDGFIVTNNHVIQGANELEITLNDNRTFPAKLIGTDSKMDIALLKIDTQEKLPYAVFADSDAIKVGEWVLAVGNPYNLTSTVTAGIVSAKARNLANTGIQSFIQTDAVVNPGNSGGALVNTRGELIGINTMISSTTGAYVGYSFAVPSNMTRKIVEDIIQFGKVQQGILGVQGFELNSQIAKEQKLSSTQGFYVGSVTKNSGAEKAGILKGDIITKIDQKNIFTFSDLNAVIATKRPNDIVQAEIVRNGQAMKMAITLSKREIFQTEWNGFELENLSDQEKQSLRSDYGVKINSIQNERFRPYEKELLGAIVLRINDQNVTDVEMAQQIFNQLRNQQQIRLDIVTKTGERLRILI